MKRPIEIELVPSSWSEVNSDSQGLCRWCVTYQANQNEKHNEGATQSGSAVNVAVADLSQEVPNQLIPIYSCSFSKCIITEVH